MERKGVLKPIEGSFCWRLKGHGAVIVGINNTKSLLTRGRWSWSVFLRLYRELCAATIPYTILSPQVLKEE